MWFKYIDKIFFILLLTQQNAGYCGTCSSKPSDRRICLEQLFSPKEANILLKQHPKLTVSIIEEIFELLRENHPLFFLSPTEKSYHQDSKDFVSLFTIFATIRVGFLPLKGTIE